MYTEDNYGQVVITLTHNDYNHLLLCLGFSSGAAMQKGEYQMADRFLRLANSVNLGNPDWTPYETKSIETERTS